MINDSKGRNRTQTVTRNVQLKKQTPTPGAITWQWNVPPNRVRLTVNSVQGATSYQWYLNGTLKATTTSAQYDLPMSGNVSCGNSYTFSVKAVGSCGASPESFTYAQMPPCESGFMISPNPSSDVLVIESSTSSLEKSANPETPDIVEIELYDKMGVPRQKQKFQRGQKKVTISVTDIPSDIYTLRIYDGQTWQSSKIVIQH
ncbi:MAG: T9SS type A sorting domain-containing protein [Agriterribacter sp.]